MVVEYTTLRSNLTYNVRIVVNVDIVRLNTMKVINKL